ncbi:MAG: DUF1850 domain-containing protein [Clostridiaceae bacterium]|nr:DUF1850 domain-containing protein [Clostridiaceae bacterium]
MKKRTYYIILLLIVVLPLLYPITLLQVVEGTGEEEILYQTFTQPQELFSVRWVHSVSKQPVIETYKINKDYTVGMHEMLFTENGPNLPHGPEGGTKWEIKNGVFRVYNYDLIFEKVPVRIGQVIANHTLVYRDKEVVLKDIDRPGGFVHIRVNKTPFIKYLYKEVQLWLKTK